MKFKACFSEVGIGWLEKRFLPAFERISSSRTVELIVLLTPLTVHFIHDAKALGGAEIHADFLARSPRLPSAQLTRVPCRWRSCLTRRRIS